MSKLARLIGKPKLVKIGDVELELYPLKVKDMDLIADLANDEKRSQALKEMIKRTLKNSVPDATDEEINNISLEYFEDLLVAVMEVNGLGKAEELRKKLKEMKAAKPLD
ncbi:MAG TPA: hypothetical protein ENG10_04725 [Candidatus Bathyarchaeota archaeon]|nr:hypothetical protein [Candidatus Bathyarchaeota archaeon]HEX69579.1 hypothetical protein [Candidatus Bathyarchaeota archaeon]